MDLSHDQDSTDLAKCLNYIEENHAELEPATPNSTKGEEILVLGAMGGRLDHTLSNLNALYMFRCVQVCRSPY